MYVQLQDQLQRMINLSEEEFEHFSNGLTTQHLKRKELLLREGTVCKNAYFIVSGCLRYYYVVDGEERTGQFFFENGWFADYRSFLTGEPSTQNIAALVKTEVLVLPKRHLDNMFVEIPKFEKFGRLVAENAYLGLRKRTEMLTNQTAEERYLELIKQRPKVIERIPQHYIASYLGIKPQSLSRIRKRLLDKG